MNGPDQEVGINSGGRRTDPRPGRWTPWLAGLLGIAALLSDARLLQVVGLLAVAAAVWLLIDQRRSDGTGSVTMDMGRIPARSWLERVLPIAFPALAALIVLAMLIFTLIQIGWL